MLKVHVRRPRPSALLALVAYLAGAIALPVLHRAHHAAHGADHVHTVHGTHYSDSGAQSQGLSGLAREGGAASDEAAHHAAFDLDLAAVSLAEVAHAGTATVDCSLAAFTLADCDDSLPADHPRGFGDLLLAHQAPAPEPFDAEHGRGTLEHGSAPLIAVPIFLLPPPASPALRLEPVLLASTLRTAPRITHPPRGPPSLIDS